MITRRLLGAALAFLASGPALAGAGLPGGPDDGGVRPWNAEACEHLLNRAAFGGDGEAIRRAVELGREGLVELLLAGEGPEPEPFFVDVPLRPRRADMEEGDYRKALADYKAASRRATAQFCGRWVDQMRRGGHPLRERMTLFWHGHFTSSIRDVSSVRAMVAQNELYREHALGSFEDLLRDVLGDTAMNVYLDNHKNRKGNPNENLARELLELFTLGEGNYTEKDVKEAARALTGWVRRSEDEVLFVARRHDRGAKKILGGKGRFGIDGLVDVLLDQPACAEHLAGRLIEHFEGAPPEPERRNEYARFLEKNDWRIDRFLRRLFLDPRFEDSRGERISSPIEYLVGTSVRLGIEPPPVVLYLAAGQLGQKLFDPPNVRGWEGGTAWINTSTFQQRGNYAGILLGVLELEDVLAPELDMTGYPTMEGAAMEDSMMDGDSMTGATMEAEGGAGKKAKRPSLGPELRAVQRYLANGYWPSINLGVRCERAGARSDEEIVGFLCDELLAVGVSRESRAALLRFLDVEREELAVADGELASAGRSGEHVLRRLAHLILSLPEAQLL